MNETGQVTITSSTTLTDDQLAGSGAHADDAFVDAAYAFAKKTSRGQYEAARILNSGSGGSRLAFQRHGSWQEKQNN